jgi:hypothetical protein
VFVPPVEVRDENLIGKSYWNDGQLEGDVAEILLYNRTLQPSELQAVHEYFAQKYGLFIGGVTPPLGMPTGLQAVLQDGDVELTWNAVDGASGYRVQRATSAAGPFVEIADVSTLGYSDDNVSSGSSYYYTVAAYDDDEQSATSPAVSVTLSAPPEPDPSLPTNGLILALDAEDLAAVLSSGAPIHQWVDASPLRHHATAVGNAAPTLVANAINGRHAVRFDGTSDFLTLPAGFGDLTDGMSFFVVFRPAVLQNGFKLLMLGNGPSQDAIGLGRAGSSGGYQYFTTGAGGSVDWFDTPAGLVAGEAALVSLIQDGGIAGGQSNAQIGKNGTVLGAGSVYVPQIGQRTVNYLGGSYWNDGRLHGDVAEVLLYDRKLAPLEQEAVHGYIAGKYGLDFGVVPPPLAIPGNFQVTLDEDEVALDWAPVPGATGYRLGRATSAAGPFQQIADTPATDWQDGDVVAGQSYYYAVAAYDGERESEYSDVAGVTLLDPPSPDPSLPTAGLVLALDAQDLAAAVGPGQPVYLWPDASPLGQDATAVGNAAPILIANGINGQPVVRFDGNGDYLSLPAGFQNFTDGISFYVVMRPTVPQNGFKILLLGNGPQQANIGLGRAGSGAGYQYFTDSATGAVDWFNTASGIVAGEAAVVSLIQQGGVANGTSLAQVVKNGTVIHGENVFVPPVTQRSSNYIGRSYWADGWLQGDIAEVLLYDRTLSTAEQQAVSNYLSSKYGLNP